MNIEIKIDETYVEKMHSSYCECNNDCVDCNAQVLINETYTSCYHKYKDIIFQREFQELIDKAMELSFKFDVNFDKNNEEEIEND